MQIERKKKEKMRGGEKEKKERKKSVSSRYMPYFYTSFIAISVEYFLFVSPPPSRAHKKKKV